jgi:flagellar biosynthesis protein FliQ
MADEGVWSNAESTDDAITANRRGWLAGLLARDRVMLGVVLVLAAAVRLPGIAARGMFDADQGHDVLTLLHLTRDGVVPLLGPPTSIGNFHHGAFYYYLLAPAAALSGASPVAIVLEIALLGIAAAGLTWWLARAMGGPVAGLIAGLLLALSPAAIDESTFIWNPNPIPFFAALALAAAWHARQTGRLRWWLVAIASAGVVFQLHVLGVVFLPPILALLVAEIRGARRRGDDVFTGRLIGAGAAGLALVALLFVPLLVHELQSDFGEVRNAVAYFAGGSQAPDQLNLPARFVFTLFRIVAWPLVGVVTDAPLGAALALALTLTLGSWGAATFDGERGVAVRWLLLTVAWTAVALTVLAPSLQTVVAGLPNDHYHAYLDPVVVVLLSVAAVGLATRQPEPDAAADASSAPTLVSRGVIAVGLVALAAIGISRWPPATDPNGGWPAAEEAGRRIVDITNNEPVALISVPSFKSPDAIGYPIVAAGGTIASGDPLDQHYLVIVCDRLFEPVLGATCGGPAEMEALTGLFSPTSGEHGVPELVTFDVSPRRVVSVHLVTPVVVVR